MGQLRDRMAEDLKLRRYKPATCDNYLRCARAFVAYHRKPPQQMGLDEVRAFLLCLAEQRKVAEATQHQYVAAIKFLYATTLGRPEVAVAIPWRRCPRSCRRSSAAPRSRRCSTRSARSSSARSY
ncbi:site-specific integrase [Sorangium sp. So ce1014]|uniref:site-specific integrase n=1 Tax=Sorangium sp. So ce1014 TaxID=3133326 RepID=UPI003F622016